MRLNEAENGSDDTSDEEEGKEKDGWGNLFDKKSKVTQLGNNLLTDPLIGDDAESEEAEPEDPGPSSQDTSYDSVLK